MVDPAGSVALFEVITDSKAAMSTIADSWIESYKENKSQALINLLQLFVEASGCKGKIDTLCDDFTAVIRKLTVNFNEMVSEYPLIQGGTKWKKFKTNLSDFLFHLIKGCQNSILYDDFMMPKLISLLTGLTDSQVRAFRHTSTFIVLKLLTALADAYVAMNSKLIMSQRQYDIEQKKTLGRRNLQKIEHLMSINKEMEENVACISDMISYLFKAVFVLRFRDIVPKIRALCITEIGIWMRKLPELFLDDSYLKYVGWSLNDKVSEVRLASLFVLKPLLESPDCIVKMDFFVHKFKDRIVSMTLDVDNYVAIEAVKLVSVLIQHYNRIFTSKDLECIYKLVYCDNSGVARAAGACLSNKLTTAATDHPIRIVTGKKITPNTFILKELVDFFIKSASHEHAAYLVDSLLDSCEALCDWDCMTTLLEYSSEDTLTPSQEAALIDIMVCSVKQTITGIPPFGRTVEGKTKTSKKCRKHKDIKEKLTEHFSFVLPGLINKFSSDHSNLINLLQIPLFYNLNLFLSPGLNDKVTNLLNVVRYIFEKHHDIEVLESCVKVLEYLSNEDYMLSMTLESHRNVIVENAVNNYCSAVTNWSQFTDSVESCHEDLKCSLVNSAKKLSILYSYFDLENLDLWNMVFKNLQEKAEDGILNFPDEFIKYSLTCCHFNILWSISTYENHTQETSSPSISIAELKSRYQSLMQLCEYIIKNFSFICADEAYRLFCDLLLICNKSVRSNPNFPGDFYTVSSRKLRDLLFSFLKTNVFIANTACPSIPTLYDKRILVAAYSKLFTYRVLPVYFISDLLEYYMQTYTDYGDIIDVTITRARELDVVDCARAMINVLISLFTKIEITALNTNPGDIFLALKELAKKFASFLRPEGKADVFSRVLHTEGILFAVKNVNAKDHLPRNILFLQLLSEFSNKLNVKNKLHILNLFKENIPSNSENFLSNQEWQTLLSYEKTLKC